MSRGIKQTEVNQIRVAFLLLGGKQWLGGYNYLRNLCGALCRYQPQIVPVLFVGDDTDEAMLEPFYAMRTEIVKDPVFNEKNKRMLSVQGIFFGKTDAVEKIFSRHQVDAVFENNVYFGWRMKLPVVTWLPDFQHKHLPHMFTRAAWFKRELGFRIIAATSRMIMLSSQDAKRDCQAFYGVSDERIFVVPFAVEPPEIDGAYVGECLQKYGIVQPFFYLPNQLWRHKNHTVAMEALYRVNENRSEKALIISSGSSRDHRNASYFNELEALRKRYALDDQFRLLGMIPYKDVIHLMYASCAILNPSFFEGWSTTVEEAKALKKTLVLSSIPVHREQVDESAYFFDPHSPEELSRILQSFRCETGIDASVRIDNSEKVKEYARKFMQMIRTLVSAGS